MDMPACRLCLNDKCSLLHKDEQREYLLCPECGFVFVPENQHLSLDAEKARYALHENTADNADYISYLNDVADEITRMVSGSNPSILDFGCGEHAVLTRIFKSRGLACSAYDPLYAIGQDAFLKTYDTIVLCEVLEHLRDMPAEIARIRKALKKKGHVFIRTALYDDGGLFADWWYKNDPAHISFFSKKTIQVFADKLGIKILYCKSPSILMGH
jgi:hypothetical protein